MSNSNPESNSSPSDRFPWHDRESDQVLEKLDAPEDGLSSGEAEKRLEREGHNAIGGKKEVKWWRVLLNQFQSPLVYVLLVALVITLSIQSYADAIVIAAVLVINTVVGFIQEFRAEHSVQALMEMISPKARVKRDGRKQEIPAEELVPGDMVVVREGNVIPADLRFLDCTSLQVNEAPLTGESVPVSKTAETLEGGDGDRPLSDLSNLGFMGTSVTAGKAEGVVVATGRDTEIGKIAGEVEKAGEVETPLQRRIRVMTQWIAGVILLISLSAFGIGWVMGRDLFEMLLLAVALAVAAIPAGLPIVVTVALAIGVDRMAKRHAVIRHLPAVDTLGSCTVIVSDKTGTLTQNRMTVKHVRREFGEIEVGGDSHSSEGELRQDGEAVSAENDPTLGRILMTGLLCNDVRYPSGSEEDDDEDISGDPMETALVFAARKAGLNRRELEEAWPRVDEIPFQTEKRYMATIHKPGENAERFGLGGDEALVLVKGAPEVLLDMCDRSLSEDGSDTELSREDWEERNEDLSGRGLRVLAMAMARGDDAVEAVKGDEPSGFTFLGMQGLRDPARPSAMEAVDHCHRAGIRVIMVTGDNAGTAAAISREVHIESAEEENGTPPETRTGRDIHEAPDGELDDMLARINTFARVEPVQKTRLVDRLKHSNEIVAVTGDGVNDAPALKNAHLGAAMGSGTDVAKEAGDMVITDDTFSSVYAAVEEGRTAFRNIRMATFFLLSTGAADVLIILSALALGWPLPLVPAQILWCNVVTNGIADVALAFEPGERALFVRPPRPPEEGVLNRNLIERLVLVGIWLAVGVVAVFLWAWGFDFQSGQGDSARLTFARTAALTTLVLFQKVHVFNCKSENVSVFKRSLLNNKLLLIGVLASLGVHIGAIYWPVTQNLLSLAPLDGFTWLVSTLVASTAVLVNEAHKKFRGRAAFQAEESA